MLDALFLLASNASIESTVGSAPSREPNFATDPDNNITPIPDAGDWTRHEITARVPGDSDAVLLGIFPAAGGQIELRNPELISRD